MIIGQTEQRKDLLLDLDRLTETRLLLQANSGGGKSWALRRILEQTHGKIQQIVIDVEDEFHTLREEFDYVLAGSTGGDCPADVRTAPVLARRLLELNASAIIGIFELKAHDRIRFVRQFLDALVNAPRELWHPALIVIDEAHVFCPQHGEAESAGAVIDLMTRGRKRGFCGILATQRISKLHKDAAAEANNKLIGRSALDVDMKRAADELGFSSRDEQLTLRTLKAGEFFAFGPALSDIVTRVKVGTIQTTHPRAGRLAAPPAPPQEKVKAILSKLGDLPKQAQEELNTIQALRSKVSELEMQARRAERQVAIDPQEVSRAEVRGYEKGSEEATHYWLKKKAVMVDRVSNVLRECERILSDLGGADSALQKIRVDASTAAVRGDTLHNGHIPSQLVEGLGKAERLILSALFQYPRGRNKVQLALLTGYAHSGGAFRNALGALRSKGFIEGDNGHMEITPAGIAAAGAVDPLPTGVELLRHWQGQVGKAEREILDALYESYPKPMTKGEIAEATPSRYQSDGGAFRNALGRLRTLELVQGRREMKLSEDLINVA